MITTKIEREGSLCFINISLARLEIVVNFLALQRSTYSNKLFTHFLYSPISNGLTKSKYLKYAPCIFNDYLGSEIGSTTIFCKK